MDYNILLSHGIEPQECSHLDYIDNDKEILIFAKIKPSQRECVYYHFKDTKIKEYKQKTIKSFASKSLTNLLKRRLLASLLNVLKPEITIKNI